MPGSSAERGEEGQGTGFGIDRILEILPHRYPFLLVDECFRYLRTRLLR